ncbi:MAG: ferredoxin reductase family protein [Psychrobium sp.]
MKNYCKLFATIDQRKSIGIAIVLASFIVIGSLLPDELSLQRWVAAFFAANALVSMALSFVLSTRHDTIESIFGGLDRMYQIHRWAGMWAVFSIFMHWWLVPEASQAHSGFSMAELGSDTGEWATWLLLFLITISFLKVIPYRWWKWTHRLMGLVFIITILHFVFAIKPFGLLSPAGIAMSITSVVGVYAWWYFLCGKDTSKRYLAKAQNVTVDDNVVSFEAKPLHSRPEWSAGQFAFISLKNHRHLPSEAHPFTIANYNQEGIPRFAVSGLGDYTKALIKHLQDGDKIELDMPYGRFKLAHNQRHQIWMGAGIGITPFLAWLQCLAEQPNEKMKVTLYYLVRNKEGAIFEKELTSLCQQVSQVELKVIYSDDGRLTPQAIEAHLGNDIEDAELYFCGPEPLRDSMTQGLESLGMPANRVHYELFDFRGAI